MLKRFLRFLGFIPKEIPAPEKTEAYEPQGRYLEAPAGCQVYLFYPCGIINVWKRVQVPSDALFACIAISRKSAKNKFYKHVQRILNNAKPF